MHDFLAEKMSFKAGTKIYNKLRPPYTLKKKKKHKKIMF